MKRDTKVGQDLKDGQSFSIFALSPGGKIKPRPFDYDQELLQDSSVTRLWWKFSVTNPIDCIHFLLAVQLAGCDQAHFDNIAGELNLQPEAFFKFFKHDELKWGVWELPVHYVCQESSDITDEKAIIGKGETYFLALLDYYKLKLAAWQSPA